MGLTPTFILLVFQQMNGVWEDTALEATYRVPIGIR